MSNSIAKRSKKVLTSVSACIMTIALTFGIAGTAQAYQRNLPLQSSIQVVIMHIMQPGDFAGSDSCLERKPVLWLSRADGLEGSMRLFALV